jgi:hypothetical protein
MRPGDKDSYRLVTEPQEYAICHRLLKERGDQDQPMTFPTVLARRDGKPIGFISTQPSNKAVAVGKLVVQETNRPLIIALRLSEAYENVLRLAGIKTYLFPVDRKRPEFLKVVEKLGVVEQVRESTSNIWFRRTLV